MLQTHHRAFHRLILTADFGLVTAAVLLAARLPQPAWLPGPQIVRDGLLPQLAVLLFCWFVVSDRVKLYQSRRTQSAWRETLAVLETWFGTLAGTLLIGLAWHGAPAFSPTIAFAAGLALILALRGLVRLALRHLRREGLNYRRALVVGGGRSARSLTEAITGRPHFGIRVLGQVSFGDERLDELEHLGQVEDLKDVVRRTEADYVVLCPPEDVATAALRDVFEACDEAGITCHYAPNFLSLKHLHPTVAWYGDTPALAFRVRPQSLWQQRAKRAIDVTLAGAAIVATAPLMLALAIAIKLSDGGPILFRQRRVGREGTRFSCYKFRTMCQNAERMLEALRVRSEQDGPAFKMKNDPRVTPLGRLMRRYSLDELPQLFNVLLGDMSLVGPRPPIPEEVDKYDWWQRRRISVPPGLTCIWQVAGRNRVSFDQWMKMDLYYVDHWSLWMDFKLMFQTLRVVFRGTGS